VGHGQKLLDSSAESCGRRSRRLDFLGGGRLGSRLGPGLFHTVSRVRFALRGRLALFAVLTPRTIVVPRTLITPRAVVIPRTLITPRAVVALGAILVTIITGLRAATAFVATPITVVITTTTLITSSTTTTTTAIASAATTTSIASAATTAAGAFPLDSVVVLFDLVNELDGDLLRKENRTAIIKVDPVFPGVSCQHADYRVATVQTAANFAALVLGQGQVKVRTAHALEAVPLHVGHVPAANGGEQLVGRFVRFPGIHFDRMSIKGADATVFDLIAHPISPSEGLVYVFFFDGLIEPVAEGLHNIT
jgi:hypothetical protein